MRAGLLRNRVVIEMLPPVDERPRDEYGAPLEVWAEYAVRWGAVEPLQGREFFEAQQMQAAADHRIRFRYDELTAAITPSMRLRHGAKLYDVQSVQNPDARHQELHVIVRERA